MPQGWTALWSWVGKTTGTMSKAIAQRVPLVQIPNCCPPAALPQGSATCRPGSGCNSEESGVIVSVFLELFCKKNENLLQELASTLAARLLSRFLNIFLMDTKKL